MFRYTLKFSICFLAERECVCFVCNQTVSNIAEFSSIHLHNYNDHLNICGSSIKINNSGTPTTVMLTLDILVVECGIERTMPGDRKLSKVTCLTFFTNTHYEHWDNGLKGCRKQPHIVYFVNTQMHVRIECIMQY